MLYRCGERFPSFFTLRVTGPRRYTSGRRTETPFTVGRHRTAFVSLPVSVSPEQGKETLPDVTPPPVVTERAGRRYEVQKAFGE